MSIAPTFCSECLALTRIATVGGPTCEHQEKGGASWFPAGWATMGEAARLAWIVKRQEGKTKHA